MSYITFHMLCILSVKVLIRYQMVVSLCLLHTLTRGARASIKDGGGCTALERAMEMGAITDEELFILLAESE